MSKFLSSVIEDPSPRRFHQKIRAAFTIGGGLIGTALAVVATTLIFEHFTVGAAAITVASAFVGALLGARLPSQNLIPLGSNMVPHVDYISLVIGLVGVAIGAMIVFLGLTFFGESSTIVATAIAVSITIAATTIGACFDEFLAWIILT